MAIQAGELVDKAARYTSYFGETGGMTLSGGEPLLQAPFCTEVFTRCKEKGIHTCLDTSGSVLNEAVKAMLSVTDRVLLDVKYTDPEQYRQYVGCELEAPLAFLEYLNQQDIPTTLRQVIIPTLNDNAKNIAALKAIAQTHGCVDKVELLPFKKICQTKYDALGISFPFAELPTPTKEQMQALEMIL